VENFNDVQEKRRFKRVASNIAVQYKNLRKTSELPIGSVSKNLSEGGVCFKSGEFISLACRLVLEINLPTTPKPIKAISKVAWIRKLPAGDEYELGNQFLEMTKEDKAHIMDFISKVLDTNL